MNRVSHSETTHRYKQILEKAETLIINLRDMIQLLEATIEVEEECSGIFDPANSNYSVSAQLMRNRRDNLSVLLSEIEASLGWAVH